MKKRPEDCVHCGKCIASCPSYRYFLQESYSPRGRNLILTKDLNSQALDFCLFCENCKSLCPQGLNFPEFYLQKIFQDKGYSLPTLSDSLNLLHLHPEGKRLYKKFDPSSFENYREGDFYIYLSCGLKHLYPEALFVFLEKVKSLRIKPQIPLNQDCCGIIYLSIRSKEALKKLALNKLNLFKEDKPVVTFCATCYWLFKRIYPLLFEEEADFKALSERTYFILDFLTNFLNLEPFFEEDSEILYHLPCHLKNNLTFDERSLNKILKNLSFTCCGSAKVTLWLRGFQKGYSKFWKKELIGKKVLATACTGCYLNFGFQVRRPPEIKHWIEFLK